MQGMGPSVESIPAAAQVLYGEAFKAHPPPLVSIPAKMQTGLHAGPLQEPGASPADRVGVRVQSHMLRAVAGASGVDGTAGNTATAGAVAGTVADTVADKAPDMAAGVAMECDWQTAVAETVTAGLLLSNSEAPMVASSHGSKDAAEVLHGPGCNTGDGAARVPTCLEAGHAQLAGRVHSPVTGPKDARPPMQNRQGTLAVLASIPKGPLPVQEAQPGHVLQHGMVLQPLEVSPVAVQVDAAACAIGSALVAEQQKDVHAFTMQHAGPASTVLGGVQDAAWPAIGGAQGDVEVVPLVAEEGVRDDAGMMGSDGDDSVIPARCGCCCCIMAECVHAGSTASAAYDNCHNSMHHSLPLPESKGVA